MHPIVVGYDGSETAGQAMSRAAEVATALGGELHVVTVVTDTIAKATDGGPIVMAVDAAEGVLRDAGSRLRDEYGDRLTVVTATVPAVHAGDALLRYAQAAEAGLLVVGNLRVRGLRRLLGSVPDDVAINAPCDVLIVKTT